jgi:hypothetical protein
MSALEEHTDVNHHGDPDPVVIDQPAFSKDSWLTGGSDLQEGEVQVDAISDSVKVRALSAGQLARIQDQCVTMKRDVASMDTRRMQVLTFVAGVVEPQFTEQEANQICHRYGPAFTLVVDTINQISQASDEDVERARRRFRPRR